MWLAFMSVHQYLKHAASVNFYFWYIPYLCDLFQIFYFCLNFPSSFLYVWSGFISTCMLIFSNSHCSFLPHPFFFEVFLDLIHEFYNKEALKLCLPSSFIWKNADISSINQVTPHAYLYVILIGLVALWYHYFSSSFQVFKPHYWKMFLSVNVIQLFISY